MFFHFTRGFTSPGVSKGFHQARASPAHAIMPGDWRVFKHEDFLKIFEKILPSGLAPSTRLRAMIIVALTAPSIWLKAPNFGWPGASQLRLSAARQDARQSTVRQCARHPTACT
jgi:hypothetical protein